MPPTPAPSGTLDGTRCQCITHPHLFTRGRQSTTTAWSYPQGGIVRKGRSSARWLRRESMEQVMSVICRPTSESTETARPMCKLCICLLSGSRPQSMRSSQSFFYSFSFNITPATRLQRFNNPTPEQAVIAKNWWRERAVAIVTRLESFALPPRQPRCRLPASLGLWAHIPYCRRSSVH